MTKTLTEKWREGTLPDGKYYIKLEPNFAERYDVGYSEGGDFVLYNIEDIEEVLAPVPSYGSLYNPNDGRVPVGLFTVLKLIKRDIERWQKTRPLTDLECGIKSQVVSLLKRRCCDLGKDELVSKTDKLEKMAFHYTPEEWNTMMRMVERLQEQLKEANAIIDLYFPKDKKINSVCVKPINDYRKKWGAK